MQLDYLVIMVFEIGDFFTLYISVNAKVQNESYPE